jgi:small subunit ribosomal protein S8
MVNDPVGDMLTQIRNAALAKNKMLELPYSNLKYAVADILSKEGYLTSVEKVGKTPKFMLKLGVAYTGKQPIISGIKRISKPGLRWYISVRDIPTVMGGAGIAIISTPSGVMTGREAKSKRIGGELLCEVW